MIQVSGLVFTYDPNGAAGERVRRIDIGEKPIESDRRYEVATNSMLAEGGHNYRSFTAGQGRQEHAIQYDVVRSWIVERGKVGTPSDKRIVLISPTR